VALSASYDSDFFAYFISSSARFCLLGNYAFVDSTDPSMFYLLKSMYS